MGIGWLERGVDEGEGWDFVQNVGFFDSELIIKLKQLTN